MNIPGSANPGILPGVPPADPNMKWMAAAGETCLVKSVMSGGMGFALGGFFGMFMASMAYDTPFHTPGPGAGAGGAMPPWRKQVADGFRTMGSRSWSTAKNFGAIGLMFSGVECGIEGLRAKNDIVNPTAAGCVSGAILARNAGPQAAALGCAGFAAFSVAIEAWMRMPKEDD